MNAGLAKNTIWLSIAWDKANVEGQWGFNQSTVPDLFQKNLACLY